jgi:hypothetical protein
MATRHHVVCGTPVRKDGWQWLIGVRIG